MDSKQIYKKPTNFSEVLELQKILDGKINNFSERDIRKIQLSLIAELIELNEELECTHKTWKKKEFDIGKQKEEAVDVFFFLAQLINFIDVDKKVDDGGWN